MSTLSGCHPRLSSAASRLSESVLESLECSRMESRPLSRRFGSSLCLPSTRFCPRPRYRGVIGLVSSVLSADLPPSPTFTSGVSLRVGFFQGGLAWTPLGSRASQGKTHHLPVCRPAPVRFALSDIGTCLSMSARPAHHTHVAGSLFATYTVLPHTSSGPIFSDDALVLLALSFRPKCGGLLAGALSCPQRGIILTPSTLSCEFPLQFSVNAPCLAHIRDSSLSAQNDDNGL